MTSRRCWPMVWLVFVALFPARVNAQDVQTHLRVVLDTSKSMNKQDPDRLALLATALLYDLARPAMRDGSSFEVIPFNRGFVWKDTSVPPLEVGPSIHPGIANQERAVLQQRLFGLEYDAENTYFYPGLWKAYNQLQKKPGGAEVRRVIVVVTDGWPEKPKEEMAHLRESLLPLLHGSGAKPVNVHILAFGPAASQDLAKQFFNPILDAGSHRIGGLFVADGRTMLRKITDIFAHSFGYRTQSLTPDQIVDLGRNKPPRVGVVGSWPGNNVTPRFEVSAPPPASTPFNGLDLMSGRDANIERAYGLRWLLEPKGSGRIATTLPGGEFFMLSPSEIVPTIEFNGAGPSRYLVMNGSPLPLRLRVTQAGIKGDPCANLAGACDMSVRTEVWIAQEGVDAKAGFNEKNYTREEPKPTGGAGTPDGDSRVFDLGGVIIEADRLTHKKWPVQAYVGIFISRGSAVIAHVEPTKVPIEIWPELRLVATPPQLPLIKNGQTAIGLSDSGWCTAPFKFTLVGQLPAGDSYWLSATAVSAVDGLDLLLDSKLAANPAVVAPSSRGATAPASDWAGGVRVSGDELMGPHVICATSGRRIGSTSATQAQVRFRLTQPYPYDQLDVFVTPTVTVTFALAQSSFWERYQALWVLLLTALLLLALMQWLLNGLGLPPDLRTAGPNGAAVPLGPESMFGWLWSKARGRRAYLPGGHDSIGTIRPDEKALYLLQDDAGAVEEHDGRGGLRRSADGRVGLDVQRDYRVQSSARDASVFRVEFE